MVRWVEAFFARQIKPLLITTGGLPVQATVRVNQKTGMTTHAERRVYKPKGQTVCHAPTTNKFSLQPFFLRLLRSLRQKGCYLVYSE